MTVYNILVLISIDLLEKFKMNFNKGKSTQCLKTRTARPRQRWTIAARPERLQTTASIWKEVYSCHIENILAGMPPQHYAQGGPERLGTISTIEAFRRTYN